MSEEPKTENSREEKAIDLLAKLLNVKSTSEEATLIFKESNISHAKLCRAFEYWMEQCITLFGEPVFLTQNQSLRDAGVDLIMEMVKSGQKFGFQIKSYNDVKDKGLSTKVNAQITQSKRHKLNRLVVAMAGNLTDIKQSERIRGLISEIKQQNDPYVITIPPEKTLAIYNAYAERIHPLKLVLLELSDAVKIAGGLSESLSNETRDVNVKIKIDYKNLPEPKPSDKIGRFTLKFKKSELDLIDRLEKVHLTGETLKFTKDQISEFTLFEGDKIISEFGDASELTVGPTEQEVTMTISTLDENDNILSSLEKVKFGRRAGVDKGFLTLRDKNLEPLNFEITFSKPNKVNLSSGVRFANSDVLQLQKALEFRESFKKTQKIKITVHDEKIDGTLATPEDLEISEIDSNLLILNKALATLSVIVDHFFKFPESISNEEANFIIRTATLLEKRNVSVKSVKCMMKREIVLEVLKKYQKKTTKSETLGIVNEESIQGKKFVVQTVIKLDEFLPVGKIDDLLEAAQKSEDEWFDLEMKSTVEGLNAIYEIVKSNPIEEKK